MGEVPTALRAAPGSGPQSGSVDLAAQHRHLVAQHDDLDRQIVLSAAREADKLGHANERQVEERVHHRGILAAGTVAPKVLVAAADDLLGTHRGFRHPKAREDTRARSSMVTSADGASQLP
ncbi:MAG TPA: hypothetical protein VNG12_11670 [Acidimicrobiales bacterium]|nr:hypothetical protein [Acidimicrobiales bacterium]